MTLKLRPEWERTVRTKIVTICLAAARVQISQLGMIDEEKEELKSATDDLIEWLRPYFESQ